MLGMHEMTIVDLVAFFAILPAHKSYFEGEESRRVCPKLNRWAERLMDQEDMLEYLQSLKLAESVIKEAQSESAAGPRPRL